MTTAIVIATLFLGASAKNHRGLDRPASEADLLRAFGFASCVAKAYVGTSFGDDGERVADLYRQMGKGPIEPYNEIRRAVEDQEPARPALSDGKNYGLMACLEFYESATLKGIALKGARAK